MTYGQGQAFDGGGPETGLKALLPAGGHENGWYSGIGDNWMSV